jgi:hypothetical protein
VGEPTSQLRDCRALCDAPDLLKEVVGQRQSGKSRSGLELSMQILRDVAKLNHL